MIDPRLFDEIPEKPDGLEVVCQVAVMLIAVVGIIAWVLA